MHIGDIPVDAAAYDGNRLMLSRSSPVCVPVCRFVCPSNEKEFKAIYVKKKTDLGFEWQAKVEVYWESGIFHPDRSL